MLLGNVVDKKTFFKRVTSVKPIRPNRRNKQYIDSWLERNYVEVFSTLICYEWITRRGLSAMDAINNAIVELYYNPICFKNQSEADVFIDRELSTSRFVITLITIN